MNIDYSATINKYLDFVELKDLKLSPIKIQQKNIFRKHN